MALSEHLDLLAADIAFWLVGFQDSKYPINQLGGLSEKISDQLRTLAIISLLGEGNTDLFYHNLLRSGQVRETFLIRAKSEYFSDFHLAISRSRAFFDVLATGQFEFANRIVELSPDHWIPEGEYEDDFCFTRFFHLMSIDVFALDKMEKVLVQFEASLEEKDDSRLDLCKALFEKNQDDFDENFASFLHDYEIHLDQEKERGRMEDSHVVAERQVLVEGLGILRVAEKLELKTQMEYQFCPAMARFPMTVPLHGA